MGQRERLAGLQLRRRRPDPVDIRGYIDAELTAYINWPLIAAIYPNLPYNTDGLILANQPWSGAYRSARACG